jgi:hypothetical protein
MKERSLCVAGLLAALMLMFGSMEAHAQATPTATPTPGACQIAPPGAIAAICNTGAEAPPSVLGISGGNINSVSIDEKTGAVSCCPGTLGAVVQDSSLTQYVLSTNHVLARNGGKGARVREPIVQPSLPDVGCWQDTSDTVAELTKWTPITFKGGENQLDAAIAKVVQTEVTPAGPLVPGVDPLGEILNFAGPPTFLGQVSTTPFDYNSLIDGLAVMKMGRTTCLNTGRVDAFDAMGQVVYPNACNAAGSGVALFNHQILIFGQTLTAPGNACSFAQKGDSGAIVVTANFDCPQAIGMVFASASGSGPDDGGTIVAINPMQTPTHTGILDKFKVSLVGKTCTPSSFGMQVDAAHPPIEMSDALRASVEAVRSVKQIHGPRLLKQRGVVAVGIGAGDTADTSALNVYLTDDTPEIRSKVLSEVKGANVKFRHLKAKFQAL